MFTKAGKFFEDFLPAFNYANQDLSHLKSVVIIQKRLQMNWIVIANNQDLLDIMYAKSQGAT